MKIIAALACVALLLLSWLSFIGTDAATPRDDHAVATLDRLVAVESELRENILDARLGLLRNYDPLDEEANTLLSLVQRLRQDGIAPGTVDGLQDLIDQQSILLEHFKSDNALLQNALAYFGLLSGIFAPSVSDGALSARIAALSTAVLDLMIDPSGDAAEKVQALLEGLAATPAAEKDADLKNGLLVHGELLYELLPATDAVQRFLYQLHFSTQETGIRAEVLRHQAKIAFQAALDRIALYAVSLLLLLLLILLGAKLRGMLETLRRRADFERAMVDMSMRFVSATTSDMRGAVETALAELASWVGADRACFILSPPQETFLWARECAAWPSETPALRADIAGAEGDILYFPAVERMPAGAEKDVLLARGLSGWLCVPGRGDGLVARILEFEAVRQPMTWPSADLGLLRVAADNIANAVRRARYEREHARLEASLETARRMETVGALAAGVAHNFNNVIASILGHVEMQEPELVPGSRAAESAKGVRQTAEHARDLIDQVLHFGRPRATAHRAVSLTDLMARSEAQLRAALPPRARIMFEPAPSGALLRGEESQLQQVILNLCINAHQAAGGTGLVHVAVDLRGSETVIPLSHTTLDPGAYVRIAVSDTGPGMPAETLERLFEPFFTTKSDGNGLGLATVLQILRTHRGGINVRSKVGVGSVFEAFLPLADEGQDEGDARLAPGRGQTVLILHENARLLLHEEEIVAALGYEPVGYVRPQEAVAALRAAPERFDLILIAAAGPARNALTLAAQMRTLRPHLPILLSASHHDLCPSEVTAAGVVAILQVPVDSAELATALHNALAASSTATLTRREISGG